MDPTSDPTIELTNSHEVWTEVRECFVQSFRCYPLYKYMVPDDNKRDAFLRAYLDANYDVTVGTDQGILLAVKVPDDPNNNESRKTKVVGGVLFLKPSSDGCGWAIGSDEPYWKAYEKHGLADISKEGLERVKRYETWENAHICQNLGMARVPMWNGLFCSISPEFASKGVGSAVYATAIKIMAQSWMTQKKMARQQRATATNHGENPTLLRNLSEGNLNTVDGGGDPSGVVKKFIRSLSAKHLQYYALLHHRMTPPFGPTKSKIPATKLEPASQPKAPLVVAISHSDRAARFHASNGFHPVAREPFCEDGKVVFYTHVLLLDPFQTGQVSACEERMLNCNANKSSVVFQAELETPISSLM